jgi:hypothetical protein
MHSALTNTGFVSVEFSEDNLFHALVVMSKCASVLARQGCEDVEALILGAGAAGALVQK